MDQFEFQTVNIKDGTINRCSNHSILIHLNGDIQTLDNQNRLVGVMNSPKMKILPWTGLFDIKGKALYLDDVVVLDKLNYVVKWHDDNARYYLDGTVFDRSPLLNIDLTRSVAESARKLDNVDRYGIR